MKLDILPVEESFLVAAAKRGDQAAREQILENHRSSITQHARRMLRSAEDAEDAVQETFVKAFKALSAFDPSRPLSPWLMRICTNCCVDIIRSRKTQPESLENHEYALFDEKAEVGAGAENRLLVESIKEAVSRLPKQYREAILLRHDRHLDVEEIARRLNKPEGTIKSWLFRARAMLKKDLAPAIG